jgi:beta-glucosidase
MVLLQNKDDLLPLQDVKKIAVIGRLADVPNTGDGGSSNTRPEYVVTPLQGIQAALEDRAEVVHDDGRDLDQAQSVAQAADVVVLVVGYTDADEGEFIAPDVFQEMTAMFPTPKPEEMATAQAFVAAMSTSEAVAMPPGGDRDQLTLIAEDEALIQAIAAVQPRTIVAVMSGSAVIMEAWREAVSAILMIWYPGMEGGHALADILLGKVNPSGKLPFIVPKRDEDLPFFDKDAPEIEYDLWHGYRKLEREAITPAFAFGFGLSYTSYRYENLKLSQTELTPTGILRVSIDVANIDATAGEEVVQVYASAIGSAVERPVKELKAFMRTAVQAGETKTVQIELPIARLAYYDKDRESFIVEAIEYELFVGAHSLDQNGLTARFMVHNDP